MIRNPVLFLLSWRFLKHPPPSLPLAALLDSSQVIWLCLGLPTQTLAEPSSSLFMPHSFHANEQGPKPFVDRLHFRPPIRIAFWSQRSNFKPDFLPACFSGAGLRHNVGSTPFLDLWCYRSPLIPPHQRLSNCWLSQHYALHPCLRWLAYYHYV